MRLHLNDWVLKSEESINLLILRWSRYALEILDQYLGPFRMGLSAWCGIQSRQWWKRTSTSSWNAAEGNPFPRRCLEKLRGDRVINASLKAESNYREPLRVYYAGEGCRYCFPWKWVHLDAKQFSEGYLHIPRLQQWKMEKDEAFSE